MASWIIPNLGRIAPYVGMLLLFLSTWYYRSEYLQAERNLEVFTQATEMVGKQAAAYNKGKEYEWKAQIGSAVASRKLALDGLRHALNSGSGATPLVTKPPEGSSNFCPDTQALAAAVERYRQRVRSLVGEGDAAQIDAQSLIESWPK